VARSIRLPRPSSPRPSLLVVGGEALDTDNFTGDLGKVVVPAAIASAAVAFGWQYGSGAYGVLLIAAAAVVFILLRWLGAGSPPPIQSENHEDGPVQGWGIIDRRGFTALASIGMIDSGARLGFLTFLPFLLL